MPSNAITVEKLAPSIGAEIRGIDPARVVDDALFQAIRTALLENQAIFFRDRAGRPDLFRRSSDGGIQGALLRERMTGPGRELSDFALGIVRRQRLQYI